MTLSRILRPSRNLVFVLLLSLSCVYLFYTFSSRQRSVQPAASAGLRKPTLSSSTAVVVAAFQRDEVDWAKLRGWELWKYEVDNPQAVHKTEINKGNEANVFLTHIIDQYDNLTSRVIFMHSSRYQWHNDHPKYDARENLQHLRLDHVDSEGYVNLRCHWYQGCPSELEFPSPPITNPPDNSPTLLNFYAYSFPNLFPGMTQPKVVASGCCSQFAVTSAVIREKSRADYVRIREWLRGTQMPDYMSGRVMEYSWHMMFGKPAVHCPDAEVCYCKLYGKCGLKCKEGDCGQYQYPFNISWFRTVFWKLKHILD